MGNCPSEMGQILERVCGSNRSKRIENGDKEKKKIRGKVVLMKKNVLKLNDLGASFCDRLHELFGKGVSLQLISTGHGHPGNGSRDKLGKEAFLEKWITTITSLSAGDYATFNIAFDWEESMGVPGAFIIRNHHHSQFYLKTVTLEDVTGQGCGVHFVCNSWVYPTHRYKYNRVFFANKTYLPCNTPESLRQYRQGELNNLRGNGSGSGMLKEWDRVYDYACYNDLGSARPVLGGPILPYPRRGRTGRKPTKPTKEDPNVEYESRLPLPDLNIYVPRDERFNHVKFTDFLGDALVSVAQGLRAEITSFDLTPNLFDTFDDVLRIYGAGSKFPMPDVIKDNNSAWRTDEEFAREMLAGVNPVSIRRLKEFPPASKLDPEEYGNQTSSITRQHIENNMDGLTIKQAIERNKVFILDYHDALMPYLSRINSTNTKTYASRTLLFLQDDGTLKPLAIELSLPHPQGDKHGATSRVFTPPQGDKRGATGSVSTSAEDSVEGTVWQLAKAYAAVNDSGYHQLISHWLNTHAVIEPFVIATNRQLSVVHPIYKLLHPHFRDTMHINALARHILINAGGILETTVFPAKFSMELSAVIYKNWDFTEQALPADLLKRGMAVPDSKQPHCLRLLIEDYPYAVDGLEIWSAIQTWVQEYCSFYYPTDYLIQRDSELQSWWTELRTVGHGDKKDEPWWPEMQTLAELTLTCTIIIWVASALHAAVNFGQYPYAGYLPNRPTVSRRFMPEAGTPEYAELEKNPQLAFLKTITAQFQTLLGVALIEILSKHSTDEIYLGQRDTPDWTLDGEPLRAFERFRTELVDIEKHIIERNNCRKWKNRVGPVKMPYMLLYPNTLDESKASGLTGKGIPNSVSI